MELEVLAGASQTLASHRPAMLIEYLKTDRTKLMDVLKAHGYVGFPAGINLLAVHPTDPLHSRVRVENNRLKLT